MNGWVAGPLLVLLLWALALLAFAAPLRARWREPVFRHPLLVIESDDWGAGPLAQAEILDAIASTLRSFRDRAGRHPVMTLGIVLEAPDAERMKREGLAGYYGRGLDDAQYAPLRNAIESGVEAGVFARQLHGQSHYWPQTLMAAARTDTKVRAWLATSPPALTEDLPTPLQSRWIDASRLPSQPLDSHEIATAVADEATTHRRIFGASPEVAVPNTFVWNADVERAWKTAGVDVVITPGRRATSRDSAGGLAEIDRLMLTGDASDAGQCYLVRDVFFEPALGHPVQRLLDGLAERTRQGRACLAETHRFNFLQQFERSLEALRAAIASSLDAYPDLRFAASIEIARAIRRGDATLVESRLLPRLRAWLARLHEIPRFRRVALFTGLLIPIRLLEHAL
jgi:hypothetical protein